MQSLMLCIQVTDKCGRLIRTCEMKREYDVTNSKNLGRFYKYVNARLAKNTVWAH